MANQNELDDAFEAGRITQAEYVTRTRAMQPIQKSDFELREETRRQVWGE